MFYPKLPDEHIDQLLPHLQRLVKAEVDRAMAIHSQLYEQHLKRLETANFSSIKILCKALGKSRQQIYNWEKGKVHGIDISGFVRKTGRFKEYDVDGIKSYIKRKVAQSEWSGSSRFSKRSV